jgi:hypothetical protein
MLKPLVLVLVTRVGKTLALGRVAVPKSWLARYDGMLPPYGSLPFMLTASTASFSSPADRVEAILKWLGPIAKGSVKKSVRS